MPVSERHVIWFWQAGAFGGVRHHCPMIGLFLVPDNDIPIRGELDHCRLRIPSGIKIGMNLVVAVLAEEFEVVEIQRNPRIVYVLFVQMDSVMDKASCLSAYLAFSVLVCDKGGSAFPPLCRMVELLDFRSVFAWHRFSFCKEAAESEDTSPLRPAWQETISPQAPILFGNHENSVAK